MNQDTNVIKGQGEKCFAGNKEVPCPDEELVLSEEQQPVFWERRFLPEGFMKNERNDMVFVSVLLGAIILILILAVLKTRIFGIELMHTQSWALIVIMVD